VLVERANEGTATRFGGSQGCARAREELRTIDRFTVSENG
jgi:hypothetical protein